MAESERSFYPRSQQTTGVNPRRHYCFAFLYLASRGVVLWGIDRAVDKSKSGS